MKPHIFVLLAFLVLLGAIVPASAYTLLATNDETTASTTGWVWESFTCDATCGYTAEIGRNITKIHGDILGWNFDNNTLPLENSIAVRIYTDTMWSGNGTLSWDVTGYDDYANSGTIDFEISDFNSSIGNPLETQIKPCVMTGYTKTCPNSVIQSLGMVHSRTSAQNTGFQEMYIRSASGKFFRGTYSTYTGSSVVAPVAGFSCVPTSQFPSTDVVCTDTSTNTPTDWLWTIDAEAMGIKGWQTSTSQNFTWQSAYAGLYTVNLRANNSAGSDWENKTNYVSISANATPNNCYLPVQSGYYRTQFQCTDTVQDSAISGCNLQLRDLEGGSWSNITDSSDGMWCIDTLPAHHVSGYGDATGYASGSRLNMDTWPSLTTYSIPMIPGFVPNATAGNIWVYVIVDENGLNLPGVTVSLSGSGLTTKSDVTDSSGTVRIQWPNSTDAYINAVKTGYTTSSRVITTSPAGPDIVHISLHKGIHTATMTPTPGPGGTVAPTIGPYGTTLPSGVMPAGYTNNQGQIMMDFLATNGLSLVQLCFLVTILALLGVKLGK